MVEEEDCINFESTWYVFSLYHLSLFNNVYQLDLPGLSNETKEIFGPGHEWSKSYELPFTSGPSKSGIWFQKYFFKNDAEVLAFIKDSAPPTYEKIIASCLVYDKFPYSLDLMKNACLEELKNEGSLHYESAKGTLRNMKKNIDDPYTGKTQVPVLEDLQKFMLEAYTRQDKRYFIPLESIIKAYPEFGIRPDDINVHTLMDIDRLAATGYVCIDQIVGLISFKTRPLVNHWNIRFIYGNIHRKGYKSISNLISFASKKIELQMLGSDFHTRLVNIVPDSVVENDYLTSKIAETRYNTFKKKQRHDRRQTKSMEG